MFLKSAFNRNVTIGSAARITLIVGLLFAATDNASGQATGMQGDAAWHEYRTTGDRTASGERFDPESMTAASNDLPFDSLVRITRLDNGKTVVVRINDRIAGDEHIIHLSDAAARHIGVTPDQSALIRLKPLLGESLTSVRRPGSVSRTRSSRIEIRIAEARPEEVENHDNPAKHTTSTENIRVVTSSPLLLTLQIGVFSSRESADAFSGTISESWVSPVTVEGKAQYRVYFSRFGEESPARVAQKRLRKQGRDSFLRTIES